MIADEVADAGVRYDVDGPVATITLNRPRTRNAQSPLMWAALREIGAALPADVRVVVVRGERTSFSSGLDRRFLTPEGIPGESSLLDVTTGLDAAGLDALLSRYQEAFAWLRTTAAITVAAVQGPAIGAGFQLALACDLRVLAEDARFAMRETSLGLVPDLGGTKPLVEAVGYARALEICVTGREVAAEEASRLGLATIVVPNADLDEAVADLAAAVIAAPARAVSATKTLLQNAVGNSAQAQLAAERGAQIRRIRDLGLPQ
jgi:enoyl-CoA hydratase/carnithine racemase